MGHSLPRTPLNHRAKFDDASFIVAVEIRNRTNTTHTHTHIQTTSKRYIHTLPIGMCGYVTLAGIAEEKSGREGRHNMEGKSANVAA